MDTLINLIKRISIFFTLGAILFFSQSISFPANALQCRDVLVALTDPSLRLSTTTFDRLTNDLRSTLGGKLATVWRSEWKAKLNGDQANQYVEKLLKQFLTVETYAEVTGGINSNDPQFVAHVHRRLFELKNQGRLDPSHDQIMVRDAPPPAGVQDSTFTYYTKSIVDGGGKHQVRIRTYLREIKPEEMSLETPIQAFDRASQNVTIVRKENDLFQVQLTENGNQALLNLSKAELQSRFGRLVFYAPHGRSFKLEIKTALKDQIGSNPSPVLGGNHMVQKLDVSLTPRQVAELFKPLNAPTTERRISEAITRINQLRTELLSSAKDEASQRRIEAVLRVLLEGVQITPEFLALSGATHYQRSAFESTAGFQTTVDWAQIVYQGIYSPLTGLMNPMTVTERGQRHVPDQNSTRHVELKFPVNAVDAVNGLTLYDSNSRQLIPDAPLNLQNFSQAIDVYAPFVTSNDHPGKFNFLRRNGTETSTVEFQGD